jgi:hypothetical protein
MSKPRSSRRGWPAGLIGALALIAAVEAFVASHELDFTTSSRMEWRQSRLDSTRRAPECGVLELGTSMAKLGLYSSVVEKESGLRAYNLACSAGRIPGSYYLLKRALDAGARPRAVILEVHPTYMEMPFQDGTVAWADLLEPLDCLDLAYEARDASFFARTMLAHFLPSYNARFEIRASILGAFKGETSLTRWLNQGLLRNLDRNAGAVVNRRDAPYYGEITQHLGNLYLQPTWKSNRFNERYLRRILALCTSKQIQVFWLIPPFVPTLQALREQIGHDAAYTFFAETVRRDYPGVIVLDGRHSGYQPPVFFDAAHLDYPGAVAFSAEVGRIVKTGLERPTELPRWVPIPLYRDRAIDTPLEDMAQSAKAMEESAKVRR